MSRALFLDRDGVINKNTDYLYKISDVVFVEGIFELCLAAQKKGYKIVIITNQSGIARGYFTETAFETLMQWMNRQFLNRGVKITDVFYCPHHPDNGVGDYKCECDCRKPRPGMILKAKKIHGVDLAASAFVGDNVTDMLAAQSAGVGQKVLYRNGGGLCREEINVAYKVINNIEDVIPLL